MVTPHHDGLLEIPGQKCSLWSVGGVQHAQFNDREWHVKKCELTAHRTDDNDDGNRVGLPLAALTKKGFQLRGCGRRRTTLRWGPRHKNRRTPHCPALPRLDRVEDLIGGARAHGPTLRDLLAPWRWDRPLEEPGIGAKDPADLNLIFTSDRTRMNGVEDSRRDFGIHGVEGGEERRQFSGGERVGVDDHRTNLPFAQITHRCRVGEDRKAACPSGVLEEFDTASRVASEEIDAECRVAAEFIHQLLPDRIAIEIGERLEEREAQLHEIEVWELRSRVSADEVAIGSPRLRSHRDRRVGSDRGRRDYRPVNDSFGRHRQRRATARWRPAASRPNVDRQRRPWLREADGSGCGRRMGRPGRR